MDAVKFLKEKKRMCDMHESCQAGCPLYEERTQNPLLIFTMCSQYCHTSPEEAVRIVEKWSAEHPVKTRQNEFLEFHPNADIREGILNLCPRRVDLNSVKMEACKRLVCSECKKQYWLAEVE